MEKLHLFQVFIFEEFGYIYEYATLKEALPNIRLLFPSPSPPARAATDLLSVFVDLPILHISSEQNYRIMQLCVAGFFCGVSLSSRFPDPFLSSAVYPPKTVGWLLGTCRVGLTFFCGGQGFGAFPSAARCLEDSHCLQREDHFEFCWPHQASCTPGAAGLLFSGSEAP